MSETQRNQGALSYREFTNAARIRRERDETKAFHMEIAHGTGAARGGNLIGDRNEINAMSTLAKPANRAKLGQCDNRLQMRLPSRRYAHEVRAAQSSKSDHGDDKFPTEQLTVSARRNDVNACIKIADQSVSNLVGSATRACVCCVGCDPPQTE